MDLEGGQLGDDIVVAASRVCLLFERPNLAPNLAQQVLEAVEVLLGGGQAALGPLLALAVLEDPGRLFDDRPPILGLGVEHVVDPALGDDDVLLATNTGVGK